MSILSKKIISNSLWMMLEKFIAIFGLIFVNSYMAKYIGPENFGKLAFVSSIFVFVQTIAWFGSQNVLFKRFSQNGSSGLKLSFASQVLRRSLYLITSVFVLLYLWFFSDKLTFIYGLGNCIACYFIISDVYTIYNNSQLQSYINALTNIIGLFIALLLRFILVYIQADVDKMVFPIIIISVLPYFLRKIYFCKKQYKIVKVKVKDKDKYRYNKYIFFTGGSLVLSTLSIALYTQISNIFLVKFTSFSDLGVYNIAMTLGSAWIFINVALITSYFSKIYAKNSLNEELRYLKHLHGLVVIISLGVFSGVLLLGEWFIEKLYGNQFIEATKLLPLIVIAAMVSSLGTISYHYMVKYNGYRYLSIKMLLIAIISVPSSYFLIKYHGVMGAATCFILVEFLSLTIANYFFKNALVFKLHLKMIFKCT